MEFFFLLRKTVSPHVKNSSNSWIFTCAWDSQSAAEKPLTLFSAMNNYCVRQNTQYLHFFSVRWFSWCPADTDCRCWLISGFDRHLGLTDTRGLKLMLVSIRQNEFRLSQAALLWISKVQGYDHVFSGWSAQKIPVIKQQNTSNNFSNLWLSLVNKITYGCLEIQNFSSHVQLNIWWVSSANEWDIKLNKRGENPYLHTPRYYSLYNCACTRKWQKPTFSKSLSVLSENWKKI